MALGKWIHNRETLMQSVFSIEDVRTAFPTLSPQVVRNGLSRMAKARKILSVHRGVYVILPAKYERRGTVPPSFYMDSLMKRLGRSYYFGLLSAARYWGASHQLPMAETVVTTRPDMSASAHRNPLFVSDWPSRLPRRRFILLATQRLTTGTMVSSQMRRALMTGPRRCARRRRKSASISSICGT